MYILVLIGTKKLKPGSDGLLHIADYAVVHEDYDEATFSNDIALVRLKTPIKFSQTVEKIELATGNVPDDVLLNVYGFGRFTVEYCVFALAINMFSFLFSFENPDTKRYRRMVSVPENCKCWMCI